MNAVSVTLLACALFPGVAYADGGVVHTSTSTAVSGAQIMAQVIGQLKGVQLGSRTATVTLDINGQQKPVTIDYSNIAGAAGSAEGGSGGDIGSLARLFAIPVAGGALLKLLSLLSRLSGRG